MIPEHILPVAVIGAGPIGLAAAAHLIQRGMQPLILEAGASPAANLDAYRHVVLFSPWRYNMDPVAKALLASERWTEPRLDMLPSAGEVIDEYLAPLAAHPQIAPNLYLNSRVTRITRAGFDKVKTAGRDNAPFVLRVETTQGEELEYRARAVIDAAGTWNQPNPLGANGLPALGEGALARRISYGMPDVLGSARARFAGMRVLVVGSGHSAAGTLIALAKLAEEDPSTRLVWAIRGANLASIFGGGANDGLPARGALGERLKGLKEAGRLELHQSFRIQALRSSGSGITVIGEAPAGHAPLVIEQVDEIVACTGSRPNLALASELRLKLDSWLESTEQLAPLIDPNVHSCGTVRPHGHRELAHPESGYYAVGAKSYGRAPNFLMATGYEQVRSVVAALAGDMAAADDVQLELPQTGVCSASLPTPSGEAEAAGCCGGSPAADASACCALDEDAKSAGEEGCGCPTEPVVPDLVAAPAAASSSCCSPAVTKVAFPKPSRSGCGPRRNAGSCA